MSEPLANLEIQDVLSSIRRLISEDKREVGRPNATGLDSIEAKAVDSQSDNKLILTSAQRIDRGVSAPEVAAEGRSGVTLEDTIAELEAAVAGIGDDFEPDGSEVAHARAGASDDELERAFEDGFEVDIGDDTDRSDRAPQSKHAVADVERESVSEDEQDNEVSGEMSAPVETSETVDAEHHEPIAGDLDETRAEPTDAVAFVEDENISDPSPLPQSVERSAAVGTTGRRIRRRLNLTAQDMVTDTAPWDRADAPERSAESGETAEVGTAAPGIGDEIAGVEGLDADALRDLITEIIRQEFKGPMGERMTRNIRMLVRREVNRALESRNAR